MATVKQVFDAAMGLMDELSSEGEAQTADTQEYVFRTPAIVNSMIAELRMMTGITGSWQPVSDIDDYISGVDTTYAQSAMPYGLAANLLVDENPTAAGFYQQRYEELRTRYTLTRPVEIEETKDLYGGLSAGENARW